ncbi:hypothetical protein FH063_002074 [Azospirillum argentinense]|uniref:Uncharacterized protein n=1 Tax=Azospirillum argentinense TaxID=2970906 RepID=A0A5B0KNI5_9PROT|nr:hypothetical protein FH063_002074 [Azospirillum argentinense]
MLRRVHGVLVRMARSGPDATAWDVAVDGCSVRATRGGLADPSAHRKFAFSAKRGLLANKSQAIIFQLM